MTTPRSDAPGAVPGRAHLGDTVISANSEVRHLYISASGTRLHAVDFGGDGRPILLLHGVTGHAWLWAAVAPALADLGRVIALDFRGHGESQWSADESYSTDQHTEDVRATLSALDASEADVVGLSWGGLVGIHLAALYPAVVRRLAVLDVPVVFGQSETDVPDRPATFPNHAAVREWEQQANPHASNELVDVMACHGTKPGPDGTLARCNDPYFRTHWPFRNDDLRDEFATLTQPVLLVHGEDSPVLSHDAAHTMAGLRPGLHVEHIPECGHLVPVEVPRKLTPILRNHLSHETHI